MKQNSKYKYLPLNANDNSFLNTKIQFIPESFDYDSGKIPYDVMQVICDVLHKWRMDYVSRAGIKNEKIKNPEAREKAVKKQIEDLKHIESKAQILLNWLNIKLKPDIPEPKGTTYITRSPKSGLANGLQEDS